MVFAGVVGFVVGGAGTLAPTFWWGATSDCGVFSHRPNSTISIAPAAITADPASRFPMLPSWK